MGAVRLAGGLIRGGVDGGLRDYGATARCSRGADVVRGCRGGRRCAGRRRVARRASGGELNAHGLSEPASRGAVALSSTAQRMGESTVRASGDTLTTMTTLPPASSEEAEDGGIVSFLRGETLFITGATGFLAKILVEKIIYEQADVGHIFLLIQTRGDQTPQDRLADIIASPAFERLRDSYGEDYLECINEKITAVNGNVAEPGLGMSDADRDMIAKRVTVFVNSAATTTFDERYDVALKVNTLGAMNCMRFAKDCGGLKLAVQVSTAFVNGMRQGYTAEKVFTPGDCIARELGQDCGELDLDAEISEGLKVAEEEEAKLRGEGMSEEEVNLAVTEKLKQVGLAKAKAFGWQDTYVFTKAMGEMLVTRERGDIPVAVIRPSIVESAWQEPVRGWIEGIRMCDPIIIAYGKGQINGFCGDPKGCLDVVPVDMVINATLASMPRLSGTSDYKVFHVATSTANPLSNRVFVDSVTSHFRASPMKDRKGQPIEVDDMTIFSTQNMFIANLFMKYRAPLMARKIKDKLLPWRAQKGTERRKEMIMKKTFEQLAYLGDIYKPYTFYQCRFGSENTEELFKSLTPGEQERFNFNLKGIDWQEYIGDVHTAGIRRFVLKGRS